MPLSWNEIKDRALKFSREWANESSEDAEAKTFWDDFFEIFGVSRRRLASFEKPVTKADGKGGFIDLLWKGILLVEHKSRGKDLDRAFKQATDYFPGLKERDLPRYVLVSDFARFRLYDLDGEVEPFEFALKDLHRQVRRFGFIAGYQVRAFKDQDPANIKAAERMGQLHDALKASGYAGHALEVLLVRLLFCLFAEDTGIFDRRQFQDFLEQRTAEDGSDMGAQLTALFQTLNTTDGKRPTTIDAQLAGFPYVNGKLFAESLPIASFDRKLRDSLLDAAGMDWSPISPAIFGALFQSIMDEKARRNLGAHYTSEKNILKLIHPLFLDDLRAAFERIKSNRNKLHDFHEKLASLKFLDPACGCGNFLVVAYRELRQLELDVILVMYEKELASGQVLDPRLLIKCNVDQFFGIEIEEFPAQIAQVALWLTDHQMNLRVQEAFGNRFVRLPLEKSAGIVHGNALRIDWNTVVPKDRLNYILGNPPFLGKKEQSAPQKADMSNVFKGVKNAGVLDFVAAWYILAVKFIHGTGIRCAFVSTNSITQGEQVGVLWPELYRLGVVIQFAHRTFKWSNEARGNAAVHCVIIGFGLTEPTARRLFDYEHLTSVAHESIAQNINPYLVDAADAVLPSRRESVFHALPIAFGSMPNDGGNLLLTDDEKNDLVGQEPDAARWIRPFLGSAEFINGISRWCLWLVGIAPGKLRQLPRVSERVAAVKGVRSGSSRGTTNSLAAMPALFGEIRQPTIRYIAIPKTSSENRAYIPTGFLEPTTIAGTEIFTIAGGTLLEFGVLTSVMHMAWVRSVCGRLKSDFRYSAGIVYNNFPWPEPSDVQRETIVQAAQGVLDARAKFPDSTLADLYDPLTMPPALVKAHQTLDRAVDAAYGKRSFKSDAERVAFLFERYQALTSLLPATGKGKKAAKRR
jgi:hypothetical protein